jgi:xylulokinase
MSGGDRFGPLLMGLDLGSTNLKAVIYEPDGRAVAQASAHLQTHYPQAGWAYYDPAELWAQCCQVIREAISAVERTERIVSIAVSSFGEAGALLDERGNPTANMIAWFDQRSRPQYERMVAEIDPDRLFAISGTTVQQIMTGPKLMWHRDQEADAWARAVLFLNTADYIACRLCGVAAQSRSLASRTGLNDLHNGTWSDELLALVNLDRSLLAPMVDGGEPLGPVHADAQALTGLTAATLVAVGGHDHPCGALAAGAVRHGDFLDSMGTTECLFIALEKPLTSVAMGRQGYTLGAHARGSYYAYGGLYTAGICYDWIKAIVAPDSDHEELLAAARAVAPGSLGVTFIPHLRLSNTPYPDSQVRGAFIGLTTDVDPAVLVRAVLEGVAFEGRAGLEPLLSFAGLPAATDGIVVGGTARNRLLLEIKASVSRMTLHILEIDEAAALGAAMLGGIAAGIYPDVNGAVSAINRNEHVVCADPDHVDRYDRLFADVYQHLYQALRPYNHALFDLFTGTALSQIQHVG